MSWLGLCTALGLASLLAAARENATWLVWYASAWPHHPWMLWTSSLVHLSQLQLLANLGALLILAILGAFLQARWPATLAVLLAWPLGTLALRWWPPLVFDPIWGTNVVNAAHLTGALAGATATLLVRSVLALPALRRLRS